MTSTGLTQRIERIEAGYEYLLAYAAQGRRNDEGSDVRSTLAQMQSALDGLSEEVTRVLAAPADSAAFFHALARDALVAHGAIALVLSRSAISSLLIDNLNASIHLRALLTDLFLIDQALKSG